MEGEEMKNPILVACFLFTFASSGGASAQSPITSADSNVHDQMISSVLAQQGELRQCCRCCFGARQEKDCVDIMEVNKCGNRGGVCTNYMPCFGRD